MRLGRRYLPLIAVLGAAATAIPAVGTETAPTVNAVNLGGVYGTTHYWSPAHVEIAASGTVTLSNPTSTSHGVEWVSTLKPSCEEGAGKVPVGTTVAASGPEWSGKCTFTQAGTYTFYCTVHHAEMTGTITVTVPGAPIVTTNEVSSPTQTGATLQGTVNPQGKPTTYHFKYGTSTSYGQESSEESAGEDSLNHHVSIPVSGLSAGTTYHYQLVAKNSVATIPGADRTFTTAFAPGAPVATTGLATSLTETTAMLNGTVNPHALGTTYFFNYGTSASYGSTTSVQSAGSDSADHAVSAALAGLFPGTIYHFQLVAHNSSGEVPGNDQTFATASPVLVPSPTTTSTQPTTSNTAGASGTPASKVGETSNITVDSLLAGSASKAILLSGHQHGASVHGSVEVASAGAGGHLEVDLFASGASLARAEHSSRQRVGRLVRSSLRAGAVSFTVSLNARAKHALSHKRRLALIVAITLTPPHGKALVLQRNVVLHT
jgi:plastocyanin